VPCVINTQATAYAEGEASRIRSSLVFPEDGQILKTLTENPLLSSSRRYKALFADIFRKKFRKTTTGLFAICVENPIAQFIYKKDRFVNFHVTENIVARSFPVLQKMSHR